MSKDGLEDLTEEQIEAVLEERKRRQDERLRKQIDEVLKRKGISYRCAKCKIPFTEDEVRRFDVCPACGSEKVNLIE